MRIVIASDSHGNNKILERIAMHELKEDNNALFYLAGDSQSKENDIAPFISVRGNTDFYPFKPYLIIKLKKHNIIIIHSKSDININTLMKENNCDIVVSGHTHMYEYNTIGDTTYLNPGSIDSPRDGIRGYFVIIEDECGELNIDFVKLIG